MDYDLSKLFPSQLALGCIMEVDDVFLCVQLKAVSDEMILQSNLGTEKCKPDLLCIMCLSDPGALQGFDGSCFLT